MWIKFSTLVLRNRLFILIGMILATLFMAYRAQFVEMSYEMSQMLPEQDSTFQKYERFKSQFERDSSSVLVVGVKDEALFKLDNFNAWQELTSLLEEIEVEVEEKGVLVKKRGVKKVLSIANSFNLYKNTKEKKFELQHIFPPPISTQVQLDSLLTDFFSLPFYKGYLYNDSSRATLIAISLDQKILNSKHRKKLIGQIQQDVQQFEDQTGIHVRYSGLPYIRANSTSKVSEEIKLFILLAGLITALILMVFFRSFKAMFFSMTVVLTGVVWALGIISLFGFKITILTGLIPPLIIVIGIPNCIFLLNKYHQEYKNHGNQIKALSRVIQKVGNAIFLTNFTTSLGFATFIFTSSEILIEFGIVTSIAIMCIFILSIFLIPIIFSYLKPPNARHTKHLENKWMKLVIERLVNIVLLRRRWVYICAIIIAVAALFGMKLIETTGSISDDIPRNDHVYLDLKFFEENFNGVLPFEILIDTKKKGKATKLSTLRKVDELQGVLESYAEFSRPLSVVEGVKFSMQAFYGGKEHKYKLFSNQEKSFLASYLSNADDSEGLLDSYVDSNKQTIRITTQMRDVGTIEMDQLISDVKPKIDSIFDPARYEVTLTGTSVVFIEGTKYLVKNLIVSLILAIIVISFIMVFLFSSARMVLVSLIPNLFPLVVTAGAMGYFGIPIKPSTILIFSIAFGISVDDTIHYLAKYRQEIKMHKLNLKEAIIVALRETGTSMIYTSVVLFFGFGVFTASDFGGTVALGLLVSFTLLVAMLANLLLLPSLLLSLQRAVVTKAFEREPLIEIVDEEEDIELSELEIKPTTTLPKDTSE
jgi:predicted RND superfamily exporter protein